MNLLFSLTYLCAVAIAQAPDTDAEEDANVEEEAAVEETSEETPTIDIQAEVDAFLGAASTPAAAPAPASPASLLNALNPRITVAADLLTTVVLDDGELNPASTMWLRSLDLELRADVDPYAKAVAVIAFEQDAPLGWPDHHDEHAEDEHAEDEHVGYHAVPEEVYLDFVALPAHLSARVGRQLLPFGITGRMHAHDWPWVDMPLPFAELMGEHSVADIGAVVSYQVHNPWGKALTLHAGLISGAFFDPEGDEAMPAWIGRVEFFENLGPVEFGLGASSMGLNAERLDGADLLIRWRSNGWHSVAFIGEVITAAGQEEVGFVGTLQVQPSRPLYLGTRVDGIGDEIRYGATVSYYTSEFLRLRLGAVTDGDALRMDGQLTFIWGSHPAEPYWVNR